MISFKWYKDRQATVIYFRLVTFTQNIENRRPYKKSKSLGNDLDTTHLALDPK